MSLGLGLVAVVYNLATYQFVYNFSHVVIMSVHDSIKFWFSLYMPAAKLDHADKPQLSKSFARSC